MAWHVAFPGLNKRERSMKYFYLFLSIAFNVASYLLYKSISGKEHNSIWIMMFALGLLLGGINVLFFTKALKDTALSIAYPVFSGGCIFFMAVLAHYIFGEKITVVNMAGALVIVVGIALMLN
jgi:multidrug transporter EmrE-like cation transporter